MTWEQALEIVVARTNHQRFRELCADDHPEHEQARRNMITLAGGDPGPAPAPAPADQSFPTMLQLAGNAAAAAQRLAKAWWSGEKVTVSKEEAERRLELCFQCDRLNQRSLTCGVCGCALRAKVVLSTEHCPLDPPKW